MDHKTLHQLRNASVSDSAQRKQKLFDNISRSYDGTRIDTRQRNFLKPEYSPLSGLACLRRKMWLNNRIGARK